jgi:hypothetical protein
MYSLFNGKDKGDGGLPSAQTSVGHHSSFYGADEKANAVADEEGSTRQGPSNNIYNRLTS